MSLLDLDDIDDPRLEPYRQVRDRDLAGRAHAFMVEGRVVLQTLLRRGLYPLSSVLVSRKRVDALMELLAQVPEAVPIFTLPHDAMVSLVGFPIHRGLLALGARPPEALSVEALLAGLASEKPATVLVVEGLTNTDNMGACFRNAAALGAQAMLLDSTCCDPLYRRAIRVSAGCALTVPFGRAPSVELLQALKRHGFYTVALALDPDALLLESCHRPAPRLAILLGSEGSGLRPETVKGADCCMTIPMASGIDSLNVATAGAVALFALRADRSDAGL